MLSQHGLCIVKTTPYGKTPGQENRISITVEQVNTCPVDHD